MFILSPKSNFLGGALVSASHLGKLFPGKLLVWNNESKFLDNNYVVYKVVKNFYDYINNICGNNISNTVDLNKVTEAIWCNDTCIDKGYYPDLRKDNMRLWEFLGNFKVVYLVNHQPISRYREYLIDMIDYLYSRGVDSIHIMNYRATWNQEWDNTLKVLFPNVMVSTLPYHYYLGYTDIHTEFKDSRDLSTAMIGRSNSKCKIQYHADFFKENLNAEQFLPNPDVNNYDFLKLLGKFNLILTGYYYGGEGLPEMNIVGNHVEWSFMDAIFGGAIPVTNTLFLDELTHLGLPELAVIDYQFGNLDDGLIHDILDIAKLPIERLNRLKNNLIYEISLGNDIIAKIIA